MLSLDFENVVVRKQQSKSNHDGPLRKDSMARADIVHSFYELNRSLQLSELLSQKSLTASKDSNEIIMVINDQPSPLPVFSHKSSAQIPFSSSTEFRKKSSRSLSHMRRAGSNNNISDKY
jgi:hypothetical protein